MLSHLILCVAIGGARLWYTVFPNLEVGWTSEFSGAQKPIQAIGSVVIVESLRQGERNYLYCNWNQTSLSANTSCFKRLVPIFTGHVLGTTCQSNTYFFAIIYTTFDVVKEKSKLALHIVGGAFFNPLYVGTKLPWFVDPTLALQKAPILACMAQHHLVELGGNLAMCQWEGQSISNTDVICGTPCSVEFKESSIHALLALVSMQRIEYFTLSNPCQLQVAPYGK